MYLNGFCFNGYRSFGKELSQIAPLKKINLIVGANNSGKSNVINFLTHHFKALCERTAQINNTALNLSDLDLHKNSTGIASLTHFGLSLPSTGEKYDDYINKFIERNLNVPRSHAHANHVEKILNSKIFKDDNGLIWFVYKFEHNHSSCKLDVKINDLLQVLSNSEWGQLGNCLNVFHGGTIKEDLLPIFLGHLSLLQKEIPEVKLIESIRKIGAPDSQPNGYSGDGIIEKLADLERPELEEREFKKEKFFQINQFLKKVLEKDGANIEIPNSKKNILVEMDNKTLPLSSLGDGIKEVIILAVAATTIDNSIVCIEEPELHLHPILQKKLVSYLSENTTNQYIFSTHSAHLLNTVDAEVFHINHDSEKSTIYSVSTTKEKHIICNDLGYKASDILQSNCVIWVEGPSDRIYINFWLRSIDKNIIEGVHYSIMFFGGNLYSHITANDPEDISFADDLVSISKLNRNSCIIFDSDKSSAQKLPNHTKKRLEKEFNAGSGFAWITQGREIENYISADIIEECVIKVHPSAKALEKKSKWANLLKYYKKITNNIVSANKVRVSNYYVSNYDANLTVFDLKDKIDQLRNFIYVSNGLVLN